MRSPKRGFTNIFKKQYDIVNLKALVEAGIVSGKKPVKLLGTGEVASALSITVNACSDAAARKVSDAGGKVEIV